MIASSLLTLALAATLLSFFARYSVLAEIATHFKVYYFATSCVAVIGFALARPPIFLGVVLLLFLFHACGIMPFYLSHEPIDPDSKSLRVTVANVLSPVRTSENSRFPLPRRIGGFLDLVKSSDLDFVFIQELHPP